VGHGKGLAQPDNKNPGSLHDQLNGLTEGVLGKLKHGQIYIADISADCLMQKLVMRGGRKGLVESIGNGWLG